MVQPLARFSSLNMHLLVINLAKLTNDCSRLILNLIICVVTRVLERRALLALCFWLYLLKAKLEI